MALAKTVPTNFQIDASYWKITTVSIYHSDKVVDVSIAGYESGAKKDMGAAPLRSMTVRIPFADVLSQKADRDAFENRIKDLLYPAVKNKANDALSVDPVSALSGALDN